MMPCPRDLRPNNIVNNPDTPPQCGRLSSRRCDPLRPTRVLVGNDVRLHPVQTGR